MKRKPASAKVINEHINYREPGNSQAQTPNIETAICREYTSRTNDGLDPNSIKAAFIISKSSSTPISDIPIH